MAEKEGWVLFRTYNNPETAAIDRGLLQANGVPCVVNNATISSVYPMTDTWAPVELMIPATQVELAEKLLGKD
jgi:hypothetical protein